MTRHLRSVPDNADGAAYVVARSVHVRPGTPLVIACCIDRGVAAVFALAGQQVCTREEMEREPELAHALRAWEAKDQTLFHVERKARAAFGRQDRKDSLREVRWHPSRTGSVQL
ncbi:MAG: hypothetical protein ACRDH9_08560 [Actinomycetota bacterium]